MVDQLCNQNILYVKLKKSRFVKEQEAKEWLSSLGLKTPLSKVSFLGDILF